MKTQKEIVESELFNTGWRKNEDKVWTKITQLNTEKISWPINAYQENAHSENFWSKARVDLISKNLDSLRINQLLEVGSGHGNVSIPLTKKGFELITLEPMLDGAKQTALAGITTINGSLKSIEGCLLTFAGIGIFDVLEHIENPKDFLISLKQKLNTGGILILTVPAHNWLFSDFDKSIGHYKRYTKKILRAEMKQAGYQEIASRYFFISLVLPAFLFRRLPYILGRNKNFTGEKGWKQSIVKSTKLNSFTDLVLYKLLKIDSMFNPPMGLSLLGIYKKD